MILHISPWIHDFCFFPGPRHIAAAKELSITNIIMGCTKWWNKRTVK